MRKYGTKAAITDLCILTGGYVCNDFDYNIEEDKSLTTRLLNIALAVTLYVNGVMVLFVRFYNLQKYFLKYIKIE